MRSGGLVTETGVMVYLVEDHIQDFRAYPYCVLIVLAFVATARGREDGTLRVDLPVRDFARRAVLVASVPLQAWKSLFLGILNNLYLANARLVLRNNLYIAYLYSKLYNIIFKIILYSLYSS